MCSTCFADGLHALLQRRSVCHITACPPRCRALPHDNIHHGPKLSRRLAVLGLSSVPAGATTVNGSAEAGQIGEEAYRKADAIKRVVKLFLQEEFSKLEEITSPEAFVYFQSPSVLPYAGRYTGQDCVRQFMGRLNESFIIITTLEAYQYVNESGSVFAAFDFVFQSVASGKEFKTSMTMKIKVDDDLKLAKIAIISDTLAQYEALN